MYELTRDKEQTSYQDEGCTKHKSCLSCPEAICLLEKPSVVKNFRDQDINRMHNAGITTKMIADYYQISVKTVRRTLFSLLKRGL